MTPAQLNQIFAQEMGYRESTLGTVMYVRFRRYNGLPIGWTELWQAYTERYPERWAVQCFPPADRMVDQANIYHLFVAEEAPRGLDINRS